MKLILSAIFVTFAFNEYVEAGNAIFNMAWPKIEPMLTPCIKLGCCINKEPTIEGDLLKVLDCIPAKGAAIKKEIKDIAMGYKAKKDQFCSADGTPKNDKVSAEIAKEKKKFENDKNLPRFLPAACCEKGMKEVLAKWKGKCHF